MRIGIDAMGGDKAPECTVKGAVLAVNEYGYNVTLIGDEVKIKKYLALTIGHDFSYFSRPPLGVKTYDSALAVGISFNLGPWWGKKSVQSQKPPPK